MKSGREDSLAGDNDKSDLSEDWSEELVSEGEASSNDDDDNDDDDEDEKEDQEKEEQQQQEESQIRERHKPSFPNRTMEDGEYTYRELCREEIELEPEPLSYGEIINPPPPPFFSECNTASTLIDRPCQAHFLSCTRGAGEVLNVPSNRYCDSFFGIS